MRWLRTAVLVAAAAPVTGAFRLGLNPSSRCPSRSVSRQQLGSSAGSAVVAEQERSTWPESTSLSLHEEIATTARGDGVAKLRKAACAAQVARAAAGGSERVRRAVAGGGGRCWKGRVAQTSLSTGRASLGFQCRCAAERQLRPSAHPPFHAVSDPAVSTVPSGHTAPLGSSVSAVSHALSGCCLFVGESLWHTGSDLWFCVGGLRIRSAYNHASSDSDIRMNVPFTLVINNLEPLRK